MSIVNDRTGRHEDDLYEEMMRDGSVPLQHLIDHLNECVVEVPEAFGSNVTAPVKMATMLFEGLIEARILLAEGKVSL